MIPGDLVAMIEAAESSAELAPLAVVLTFGFIGCLRISNLAPHKASAFDATRHTMVADIHLRNEGLVLSLKWSKSRQTNKTPVTIPLPSLGSTLLCPLRAWNRYNAHLTVAGVTPVVGSPLLLTTYEPAGRVVTTHIIYRYIVIRTEYKYVKQTIARRAFY